MVKYSSRYDFGVKKLTHKGKVVTTSLNTPFMDNLESTIKLGRDQVGTVKEYVAHRPDTLSDIFYNTSAHWWYLLLYNNITDPFESLNPGQKLLIPFLDDVFHQ